MEYQHLVIEDEVSFYRGKQKGTCTICTYEQGSGTKELLTIPIDYQEDFLELKRFTFVVFKRVEILVAIGTRFFPSEEFKALKWWKRIVIRLELAWQGISEKTKKS